MTLKEVVIAYKERFDEVPPIFGFTEEKAIVMIEAALCAEKRIEQGADEDIPDGAYL